MKTNTPPQSWTLQECGPTSHLLTFSGVKAGWEQWVQLSGDRHHDNSHTDLKLEKRLLDKARERNALIVDVGDLFDAMQGYGDPRSSKSALRVEHKADEYFDAVSEEAADFYAPYGDLFTVIALGNHESSVIKRHGIHLTKRLCRGMKERNATSQAMAGGYSGWLRFAFELSGTIRSSFNLKYFHGSGGDAPVTQGTIEHSRLVARFPDADVLVCGHNHNAYLASFARDRCHHTGRQYLDTVDLVRVPSLKDEYASGKGGWHVERGGPPKPRGCAWMRLSCERDGKETRIRRELMLDVI